jgi:hypothetical protein
MRQHQTNRNTNVQHQKRKMGIHRRKNNTQPKHIPQKNKTKANTMKSATTEAIHFTTDAIIWASGFFCGIIFGIFSYSLLLLYMMR